MKVMYQGEELEKKAGTLIRGLKTLGIPMVITQQYTKGSGEIRGYHLRGGRNAGVYGQDDLQLLQG